MPMFLEISIPLPQEVPNPPFIPMSMYTFPTSQQPTLLTPSTPQFEMDNVKNILRTFSNEIINLNRQQTSYPKPSYHGLQGNRPPY